jgi:hypothetical protein
MKIIDSFWTQKKPSLFLLLVFTAILFFYPWAVFPFGDQTSTERILTENKFFIQYANISVTNFGTEKDIALFKKSGEHNFWAKIAALQSKYKRAYKEIRDSQKILADLFRNLIDRYLIDTKVMLDRIAPMIIRSKDSRARLYLSLGYRDITESKSQQVVGVHTTKRLYSYKIKRFIEALNLCRRGKRYAILAILEARTPREKKKSIENLTFEEIGSTLLSFQEKGDPEVLPEYKFLLHHTDNYGNSIKKITIGESINYEYKSKGINANFTEEEKVDLGEKKEETPKNEPQNKTKIETINKK